MALKHLLVSLVLTCLMADTNAVRYLAATEDQNIDCGNAIAELSSCSSITLRFFQTGNPNIANCCRAIDNIIHGNCDWPAALMSLGFAVVEGNILKALCNATDVLSTVPSKLLKANLTIRSLTTISSVTSISI